MSMFAVVFLFPLFCFIFSSQGEPIVSPTVKGLLNEYFTKVARKSGFAGDVNPDGFGSRIPSEDDGTELAKNREILGELFETDIVLTEEQARDLIASIGGRRLKRKVHVDNSKRWPGKTIGYRWGLAEDRTRKAIRKGIRAWEDATCLRFQENSASPAYLYFIRGAGCYSNVGRQGLRQSVSVGPGCEKTAIVAHEIGHALGFWHEQSRPNRDSFIRINSNHIVRGTEGNFQKRAHSSVDDFDAPYDMGSVMHYGPKAFSLRWDLRTIDTLNDKYQHTIGQRTDISFVDAKQINKAYCSDVCRTSLSCKHGGYPDPKNCRTCRCPEGLAGTTCDRAARSTSSCGGDLTATTTWKTIRSPKLAGRTGDVCYWHIKAPRNGHILIDIRSLSYPCRDTCINYAEVKSGNDFQAVGARFCCDKPSSSFWSDTDEIVIIHRTNDNSANYNGFEIKYKSDRTGSVAPRPAPISSSHWGQWSSWSRCSRDCGGCGRKNRQRTCLSNRCPGNFIEEASCGSDMCWGKLTKCRIMLQVPCSILWRFQSFDPAKVNFQVGGLPRDFPGGEVKLERSKPSGVHPGFDKRKKRQTSLCSRWFTYACRPLSTSERGINDEGCCTGYRPSGNTCIKN